MLHYSIGKQWLPHMFMPDGNILHCDAPSGNTGLATGDARRYLDMSIQDGCNHVRHSSHCQWHEARTES